MAPEEKARQAIDQQLAECGWLVQDFKQLNISAGLGVAVREFPLKTGHADYLLEQFVPVRIDVTEETQANREQLQRYAIVSLPAVLVLDSHGRVVDRIDEFLSSDAFLSRLAKTRTRRQVQARAR